MTEKKTAASKGVPEVSRVILDSGTAEMMYARGEISLTKTQVAQLASQPTIALTPDQAPDFKPKVRAQPVEWMTALDAVHWLSPHVGGDAQAKRAIAERLKDGALECSCVWLAESLDVGELPTRRPTVSKEMKVGTAFRIAPPTPLPSEIRLGGMMFSFSDNWERDLDRWKWDSGTIVTSNQHGAKLETVDEEGQARIVMAPARMVAFGVRFLREDIERIAGPAAADSSKQADVTARKRPSRGKSGSQPRKKRNARAAFPREIIAGEHALMEELLGKVRDGSISEFGPRTVRGTQARIKRHIILRLTQPDGEELSWSSAHRRVTIIMNAWHDKERANKSS